MKKLINVIISALVSFIVLALCVYAIHDIQTAEGIGFYYCLKLNAPSRLPFDIAADIILAILFFLLLLLPLCFCKRKTICDFTCFLLMCVTFIPSISIDYILSLKSVERYQIYLEADSLAIEFIQHFRVLIPLIILLAGVNYVIKDKLPAKSDWRLMVIAFIIIIVTVPFPGLYSMASFLASYLFVIVMFKMMEGLSSKLWLLHIIFFFTSIYNIITVCQTYSL